MGEEVEVTKNISHMQVQNACRPIFLPFWQVFIYFLPLCIVLCRAERYSMPRSKKKSQKNVENMIFPHMHLHMSIFCCTFAP